MRTWASPHIPTVTGTGIEPTITDSSSGERKPVDAPPTARLYICGITPYDATHMGHAATYVMLDLLHRALLDAGHEVTYCENVTDVDDPLLERAERDGVNWQDLAAEQTNLFRDDMAALRVLPPNHFIGVSEYIEPIAAGVTKLLDNAAAYTVPITDGTAVSDTAHDIYLDLSTQSTFGNSSTWSRSRMMEVFADRGGDPDREGKRDQLDPLLWRAARIGEPAWDVEGLPSGRPGWHIECTCIALDHLGPSFDVQAGGVDLIFPHHEMSAVQADALAGEGSFARLYLHQEMVGLDGEKMSKSKGNLIFVSKLRAAGEDPMAIRLAILAHHYATAWEWTDEVLHTAKERLHRWRTHIPALPIEAQNAIVHHVRERIADDLDAPGALAAIDAILAGHTPADAPADADNLAARIIDAILGIAL
ncbi:cysteine--1-D-myo-inosityl 2-amino-2-deoxy-alpha-D-glucopyranoside ligase [Dermatophilus congolensis]|uniref:cysteine--1-D-myo-inosityl 2-amino-2-deoxy-alpha-D-glucopyranoside ligase n=1 Tax=Dermatophilus congolensis TaxID=1863 RepID=UPI00047F6675